MVKQSQVVSVVIAAPPRRSAHVREMLDQLGPMCTRGTTIDASGAPTEALVAASRSATPSRGVVAVVDHESEIESRLAAGADEVLVVPLQPEELERALRRASVRAGVRDDRAVEARMIEQVLVGVARGAEAPLAAIALDVDSLRSGSLEQRGFEEVENALEDCGAAVEQVARVLREAAVLTSPDSRRESLDHVALGPLLEQVLRVLGGSAALRAHVEVQGGDALPDVLAPRRTLARTLAQVIVHALDAVPEDDGPALRRLRIAANALPDSAAIAIEVRPGLDAPPPSSRVALGLEGRLAVLRASLRSFEGELVAERAKDGSVRLVVFLPRAKGSGRRPRLREEASISSVPPRRPRVLVVDPDERVLRAATRALGDRFEVLLATCGEEALAVARESSIDLLVLDMRLPDMSTEALAEELRNLDPKFASRFALVGSAGDETKRSDGIPVLEKPVRRSELLAALDTLLESLPRTATGRRRIMLN